jgi:hypothetical protein
MTLIAVCAILVWCRSQSVLRFLFLLYITHLLFAHRLLSQAYHRLIPGLLGSQTMQCPLLHKKV